MVSKSVEGYKELANLFSPRDEHEVGVRLRSAVQRLQGSPRLGRQVGILVEDRVLEQGM